jgi:hypothetical protein
MDRILPRRSAVVLASGAVALLVLLAIGTMLLRGRSVLPGLEVAGNSSRLAREIQGALDSAEGAGRLSGRRELDAWHLKILDRVDKQFLEHHLGYGAKWMTTARYLWTATVSGTDKAITEQLEAQERLFKDTVTSEEELRTELTAIARNMAMAFADALDAGLADIARQHQMTDAEINAYLVDVEVPEIAIGVPAAEDAQRIRRRFRFVERLLRVADRMIPRAIDVLSAPTGLELIHGASKEAAAVGSKAALKSAAHKAALGGAKAASAKTAAATAAKAGGVVVGGPFALVAIAGIVAWEWWDHSTSVAVQKPRLLRQIDEAFAAYETALLDADGQLGNILVQMTEIVRMRAVR